MRPSQPTRAPEVERDAARLPALGYEPPESSGWIRCLSHGFPTPLARWHFHDEYELHLITATSGRAFVGDWIGPFQAGHLVLCGPRLPHNWVSTDMPPEGVAERDLVVQFAHGPIAAAAREIPELAPVLPLLDRARQGIEFFGLSERALEHWHRVRARHGLARLGAFCEWLADLAACTDYRILSATQLQGEQSVHADRIDGILQRITGDLTQPLAARDLAAELNMSESRFCRFFQRETGNTFTEFVTRVRITRACQLLVETEQRIGDVCWEVGFNNLANFNRQFLRVKGMTPTEYRRQAAARYGRSA